MSTGADEDAGDAPAPGEPTKSDAGAELERRERIAEAMGGRERVAAQHARGRLTARERIERLLDADSFVELGKLAISDRPEVGERAPADASITGVGLLDGRKVAVIATDATVLAGTTGRVGSYKQGQIMSLAARKGYPLVMLGDANGGRLPDLLGSDFAAAAGGDEGEHFLGIRVATERIPRVTAILGNAYGDPAFWAGSSDFVSMAEGCSIALSGPSLVGASTGAASSHDQLGGPAVSVKETGLVSRLEPGEDAAIRALGRFLSYLPSHAGLPAPALPAAEPGTPGSELPGIVPDRGRRGYDVRRVIDGVLDAATFFELHPEWARSVVCGLGRVAGRSVALIANQPRFRGGVIDAPAAEKVARIVDVADAFGLPLVFLQDMPGVMIGDEAEREGIIRRLIDLYRGIARSRVPKVTVILRKAFGFGYMTLGGPNMGSDYVVAWPNAEIGFMSADNAVHVLHHRRLIEVQAERGDAAARELAAELEAEMHSAFAPWRAAERAHLHAVIRPQDTRRAVLDGLFVAEGYR